MNLEEYARQQQNQTHPEPQQRTRYATEQAEQRQAAEQAAAVARAYQDNIKKAGQTTTAILDGLHRGERLEILFLQAVEAYTLCVGNRSDYDMIKETYCTVYGKALHDAGAVEMVADDVRERLERLRAARERTTDSRERQRIERAITAHEKELASLL